MKRMVTLLGLAESLVGFAGETKRIVLNVEDFSIQVRNSGVGPYEVFIDSEVDVLA